MRWIMNALLVSVCSLTYGGPSLLAQTPDKAPEQAPKQDGAQEQQPRSEDERGQPTPEGNRRGRGPGGPLGGPFGPGGPGPRMMLARLPLMMALDADGDGEISTSEIEGAVAALKKLDKNADGKLTLEELAPEGMRGPGGPGAPDPAAMVERMMMADANGDGVIDQDEMPERMKVMMLERADTDKDGKLSREELTKMAAQMGGRRGPGGPRGPRDGGDDQPERPRRPRSE